MIGYILRRIAYGFLILLGVNALTFALFFAVNTPDDMARLAIGGRYVKKNAMLPMPAAWNARPSAFFFPGLLCFPGYCSRSRRPSRCGSGPKKGMPLFGGIPVRAGPVSRVLFPGRTPGPCHLSRAAVSCRLKQPTPRHRASNP